MLPHQKSRQGVRVFSCAPFIIVFALLLATLTCFGPRLSCLPAAHAEGAPADDSLFDPVEPVSGSSGKHPKFTLLYNAMTMGEVHPCPT